MIIETFLMAGFVIFCYVTFLFVVSILITRNDIADVAWGPGIALVALSSLWSTGNIHPSAVLITSLICIWAIRLAYRIGKKNLHKEEDSRYKRWRDTWGIWFYPRSYMQVFLLQGFLMLLVGYSAIHASATDSVMLLTTSVIGCTVWVFGFLFEAISDYQLDKYIADPNTSGGIMRSGLWKYSRHPNYFGEVIMWWGLWIVLLPAPLSLIALISPVTITILILFVSGIPLLEAQFKDRPGFDDYKKTTNVFIPWWPKK